MEIKLIERIVVRDEDTTSATYGRIKSLRRRYVDHYHSNTIPRIGEIVAVKEARDSSLVYYDVVAVIHFFDQYNRNNTYDENTVEVEVKRHVNVHEFENDGYVIREEWPIISELKHK